MQISIVTTLYRSEDYISEFYRRASSAAQKIAGEDYEIIFVNDGSPDDSLDVAVKLTSQDYHVVVIDLSRNFGHHKAMMTGLKYSRGEMIFLLDSDLEEDPEWLIKYKSHLDNHDYDVAYGIQEKRKGNIGERNIGKIFYKIFRLLTGINQPDNIVTARLMTRRYVDALLLHKEKELNIGGLWIITGFKQKPIPIVKHSSSPTTYSAVAKINHLVNAVTSFSSLPLVIAFYSGLLISGAALLFIIYLLFRYFFMSMPPEGYTSIVASIWFFSGLIILFIGVQGIYLSKVFTEVKDRPYTIVRDIYRNISDKETYDDI